MASIGAFPVSIYTSEVPEEIRAAIEENFVGTVLHPLTPQEIIAYTMHQFQYEVVPVLTKDNRAFFLLSRAEYSRLREQQELLDGDRAEAPTLAVHLRPHEAALLRSALALLHEVPPQKIQRLTSALEVAVQQPGPLVEMGSRFRKVRR